MKAVRPSSTRKCSGTEAGSKPGGASIAMAEQLNSIDTTSINERIVRTFPVLPHDGRKQACPSRSQTDAREFIFLDRTRRPNVTPHPLGETRTSPTTRRVIESQPT